MTMTKAKASASGARRSQVANACQACRASKVKCSGKHPTCARCTARGIECTYDVSEEGMTRRQHLRQEFDDQRRELDSAMNILDVLRHGSDQEATETLARIRLGQTLREANEGIENARSLKNEEGGSSVGDAQSAPDMPSTHSFDHQGPYPSLDRARARASFSTTSAIPSSSYWSQGPPQPQMQAFTQSSLGGLGQQQQQQQQQNLGTLETQDLAWQSPLSTEPQSAVSEWSGVSVQQFEPFDFEMDSDMQQLDHGSGENDPGSNASFGHDYKMN